MANSQLQLLLLLRMLLLLLLLLPQAKHQMSLTINRRCCCLRTSEIQAKSQGQSQVQSLFPIGNRFFGAQPSAGTPGDSHTFLGGQRMECSAQSPIPQSLCHSLMHFGAIHCH
uniref:HDC10130 n=1 Tax=Drosophila melanogaster TaxID=7227 RepID=Q6IL76_DROME|nr:TPA_inf: HDC10130 [Drosophila melanogaster]